MSEVATSQAYHQDARRFRDALTHTASGTGFSERLIEKDYFCSILLEDLGALFKQGLVFKGGTCLSKVHAEFFRLSEDLDFAMSVKPDASRGDRRRADPDNQLCRMQSRRNRSPTPPSSPEQAAAQRTEQQQTVHAGQFAYRSLVTGDNESIQMEVLLPDKRGVITFRAT